MRGQDHQQSDMFSYLAPEQRVRKDHPLRAIRALADEALDKMSERFDSMYATTGRPSIPPEKLLRAQSIQMLYSVRSERLLMEPGPEERTAEPDSGNAQIPGLRPALTDMSEKISQRPSRGQSVSDHTRIVPSYDRRLTFFWGAGKRGCCAPVRNPFSDESANNMKTVEGCDDDTGYIETAEV